MRRHSLGLALIALCARAAAAQAAESAEASEASEASEPAALRIEVIELHYADAYEVANLLSQLAPPGVRVAAYGPTNSLVISGPEALLGPLLEKSEPSAKSESSSREE
jgi:type II secretory pathway component GspD/PulD (secretin)